MNSFSSTLKNNVHDFWQEQTCGTDLTTEQKYSKKYFDSIEEERYVRCPEVFSFAQFTRYRGKRILEIGIGAGTDFVQWVRAGASASGIDLTEEAIQHTKERLALEGLRAEELSVADCENLPYPDASFDVVYSYGVLHHTPNTEQAIHETLRVCNDGGKVKIMLYHRRSIVVAFFWVKHALLKFRPWKSPAWCLYHFMESKGTKAYTKAEAQAILDRSGYTLSNVRIEPILTYYDDMSRFNAFFGAVSTVLAWIFGNSAGWFLLIDATKSVPSEISDRA
jgi:ubiquinone/menaquinone biosynthesis C-methylase UbiE